jgi:hypothetical protein
MLNSLVGIYGNGVVAGDYQSISTVTVGAGGAASITFSSIPATYQHLQIRLLARSLDSAGTVNLTTQLNGDTGSNYSWHRVFGNGTSTGAGGSATQTNAIIGQISGATAASSIFGVASIDLLDYKETTKYKTIRSLVGFDDNNGGAGAVVQLFSGLWQSSSATTSIALSSGTGFAQYTHAALYGIKG